MGLTEMARVGLAGRFQAQKDGLVEASSVGFTSLETAAWSLLSESEDKSLVKNERHQGERQSLKYSCVV